jgi:hypothetical protein
MRWVDQPKRRLPHDGLRYDIVSGGTLKFRGYWHSVREALRSEHGIILQSGAVAIDGIAGC